jgi:hypothetical protein
MNMKSRINWTAAAYTAGVVALVSCAPLALAIFPFLAVAIGVASLIGVVLWAFWTLIVLVYNEFDRL